MLYIGRPGCERAFGDLGTDQTFRGECFGIVGTDSQFGDFEAQTVEVVVLNPCRVRWCPDAGIRRGHTTSSHPAGPDVQSGRKTRRDWLAGAMFGGRLDD
jgi:hypothetical protein